MTAEFDSTVADYAEFLRHHTRRGSGRWALLYQVGVMAGCAVLLGLLAIAMQLLLQVTGVTILLGACALFILAMSVLIFLSAWFVTPALGAERGLRTPEERAQFTGHRVITFSPEGVAWRHSVGYGAATWQGINRVEADANALYLYFGATSGMWVPRRAFQTPAEFQEWGDYSKRRVAEAHGKPPAAA